VILVIGATGTIGRAVVAELQRMSVPVRAFVRDAAKLDALGFGGVPRIVGDLDEPTAIARAMQGVTRAFVLTLGFGPARDASVIEAARAAGVRHLVKLSIGGADRSPLELHRWHRERELLYERAGLAWTFLRPTMFMSNCLAWADGVKKGAVFFPGGKGLVAPIDPRDVAAVAARALIEDHHAGQAYELTGPSLYGIREMVETIASAVGRRVRYVDVPMFAARVFMRASALDKRLANALLETTAAVKAGGRDTLTETCARLLGRRPTAFDAWCRDHRAALLAP
jgi:uncharacterized protein YbjT (DUF2867 family)